MTLEEFYRKCDELVPDEYGCLNWTGKDGVIGCHKRVRIRGRGQVLAHHLALERKLGKRIQLGTRALHKCDNPSCVNMGHLREGTQHLAKGWDYWQKVAKKK
jgi:hypothetical protein